MQLPAPLGDLAAIALEAGSAIMSVYALPDVALAEKADGSPVTEADRLAEGIILARLADLAPDVPVVAEETAAAGQTPAVGTTFFLVDPLDGTREFISRNGEFTVNIALVVDGVPVRGVVFAPALGHLYAGDRAAGAFHARVESGVLAEVRSISVRDPDHTRLTVVASRSHLTAETRAFVERFSVGAFSSAGSSLKFCLVAAGEADLYPRLGRTMEWDTAAGDAVLRAAGGKVLDLEGRPLAYGKTRQPHDEDFANPWFVASGPFDPLALASA